MSVTASPPLSLAATSCPPDRWDSWPQVSQDLRQPSAKPPKKPSVSLSIS